MIDIEKQLDVLAQERRGYVTRLNHILNNNQHQDEVAAYLLLIGRVNDAAVRLAGMRRDERLAVGIQAICKLGGKTYPIEVVNISRGGLAIRGAPGAYEDDILEICLMNGRCEVAQVRWWLEGYCGVSFLKRLEASDPLLTNSKN